MLRKLRAIIVGGLALCCLYLFALYLRADGGGLVKNAISLADVAQETVCPTEAPAATEAPPQSAAPASSHPPPGMGRVSSPGTVMQRDEKTENWLPVPTFTSISCSRSRTAERKLA